MWRDTAWAKFNFTAAGAERTLSIAAAVLVLCFWGATLTWAAMLLVAAILFQDSLRAIFAGLSAFFSRTAELEIYLGENRSFKFSAPIASEVLQKITDEIKLTLSRLSDDQIELFLYMAQNPAVRETTLSGGPLKFARVNPRSVLHWDLRDLRAFGLARPAESSSWREAARPAITPFGELAQTIFFADRKSNVQYIEQYLEERAHLPSGRNNS